MSIIGLNQQSYEKWQLNFIERQTNQENAERNHGKLIEASCKTGLCFMHHCDVNM